MTNQDRGKSSRRTSAAHSAPASDAKTVRYGFLTVGFSRRAMLKLMGASAAAGCLPGPSVAQGSDAEWLRRFGPIDRTLGERAPAAFSGDQPERAHGILWDKPAYLARSGPIPVPEERVPLVVIGGGMSGLLTAYLLRDFRPVVLERAARFGGNSRGESWDGVDYSIGAAYFLQPAKGSALAGLMSELGVDKLWRVREQEDPVVWNGKPYRGFWQGATAPDAKPQFDRLAAHFRTVFEEREGYTFPQIPILAPAKRAGVERLDRATLREHLLSAMGERLHPHLDSAIEAFCWAAFAASASEISAAAGLNFLASEVAKVVVTPGGNAAVAERALGRILGAVAPGNLRAGCVVFDAAVHADGVTVAYEDPQGRVRSIRARAAVMACPKFVAVRVLRDLEPARLAAIRQLRYHAYLVGNVLLKGAVPEEFYDMFMIGDGQLVSGDPIATSEKLRITDVSLGTFARPRADRSVLTLYRPIPHLGGRGTIFAPGAYERYRAEFEDSIERLVLPLVAKSSADLVDLRIARWGHPIPVAARGLIAGGVIDAIRAPFRERVFFVEQDNWMLPALETCANEALLWAPRVRALLA
jgi:hypothetical protein